MHLRRLLTISMIVGGFGGAVLGLSTATASGTRVAEIEISGTIDRVSASYLSRAIDKAEADDAEVLIVHLDTPGGVLDSIRDMVEAIFEARIPVAVFVSPAGSRAVGGGTYILAAAHIAAMAPASNTGAVALPDAGTLESRTDIRAWLRSIAQERGRNEEALDATASRREAYTTAEALELGVIDLVANDTEELVRLLDGRSVRVRGATVVLETSDLEVTEIDKTPLEHVRGFLANPNIAFALLALGGLGILIELASPGLVAPGAFGGLALALGLVATETLPINWVGAGLLALSAGLVYVELQATGGFMFGAAGAASFLLGGFLLFGGITPPPVEAPSFRVNIFVNYRPRASHLRPASLRRQGYGPCAPEWRSERPRGAGRADWDGVVCSRPPRHGLHRWRELERRYGV